MDHKKFNELKVPLSAEVTAEELLESIFWALTTEQLIEFVKRIDDYAADFEFSEPLYKYFKKQHKQYKREVKQDGV